MLLLIQLTLELVSTLKKTKIVVYSVSEDLFLTSFVVNNRYKKTVEIIRTYQNHYEAVFSEQRMRVITFCQNLAFNVCPQLSHSHYNYPLFIKNLSSWKIACKTNQQPQTPKDFGPEFPKQTSLRISHSK
jgi:hypothetical protein